MNAQHPEYQLGLSLLESMVAVNILLIAILSMGPLIYAGFSARQRAELRTAATHRVQNRQELSRAGLLVPGGCMGVSQGGQEIITIDRYQCRLNWSIQPIGSTVPSPGKLLLVQIEAALRCPVSADRPTAGMSELQTCRSE